MVARERLPESVSESVRVIEHNPHEFEFGDW